MKPGLFIDAGKRLSFDFEGRRLSALAGDTIATALWREGTKTLSRSFKYHRRRGILSLSGADANTLVDVGDAPNVQADRQPVTADLVVRARHCWGGVENDRLAFMDMLSPLLPPGFYYKAFFKPHGAWPRWEPLIRRLAGLGQVNPAATPVHVDKIHDFCQVAVIGGGPAGLAAAIAAAHAGKTVCLLDKNPQLGGTLNWRGGDRIMLEEVTAAKNIKSLVSCEATGVFADNLIIAHTPDYSLRLRADKIIYATGTRELPAVFTNNDLPGVMLVAAALRLAFLYDLACGRRAVMLVGSSADADAARALQTYGVNIAGVFNLAAADAEWAQALAADGFAVHHNITAFAAAGRHSVSGVCATANGKQVKLTCDCVLINGGAIAAAELPASAGISFPYDTTLRRPVAPLAAETPQATLAGALNNRRSLAAAIADGTAAANNNERPPADLTPLPEQLLLWNGRGKAFIDFDEDLQPKDLDAAIDEGFDDIQLLKRYTTAGMGPAQGKLTNLLVMRHLANRRQCDPTTAGQVTARPPAAAETLAQLAHSVHPIKRTALHSSHIHLSAAFMPAGAWLRPTNYINAANAALAVRENAGIIDISTLGKMQISGPDAAVLLERLYTGKFTKQKPGTIRYALMLDESGVIADDGVVARLDDNRFWVTTTTGNADLIYRQMLLWCARWRLKADIINMTSAFAAINLAGPNAMPLLANLAEQEIDLGYMRAAEISINGVPALIMRVGFVGEKGYEIHLPMGYAAALWNILLADATAFGVEAQRLLRLEKGHVIVGQDTDGLTTPLEANMEWALGRDKSFYLGQRALVIHRRRGIVRQLRGFILDDWRKKRLDESDLVLDEKGNAVGRVTSVAYSPILKRVIGLAYAPANTPETGGTLKFRIASGELIQAQTLAPPFYDPQGERQQ